MPRLMLNIQSGDTRHLHHMLHVPEAFIYRLPKELFQHDRFDDSVFCCTVNRFKEVLDSMIFEYLACEEFAEMIKEDIVDFPDDAEVLMCLWDR